MNYKDMSKRQLCKINRELYIERDGLLAVINAMVLDPGCVEEDGDGNKLIPQEVIVKIGSNRVKVVPVNNGVKLEVQP